MPDFVVHALEPRRLMARHPLAVNFNDEALWDANFPAAVQQAKSLGVTAVRVWLPFNGYADRPNAYDPTQTFGSVYVDGVPSENDAEQAMARIFDLKDAGFTVLVSVNDNTKSMPTSAAQVKAFYQHLLDSPETLGDKRTLAEAVDYWEVGNEPDSGNFWNPSAPTKTVRLQSYVDQLLIPAGQTLHGEGEKVVSAGVSYDPADVKTILDRLRSQNQLSTIDAVGFHPYGTHTSGSAASQVATRTAGAKSLAAAAGKPLFATEWNIRGFGTSGSNNAAWAAAIDDAFRRIIDPNFDLAFYFALVNNWAGRGGTTSARPGGLLKHTYTGAVQPLSSVPTLKAYYQSSLVAASPFYSTFAAWSTAPATTTGSISGRIISQSMSWQKDVESTPWTLYIDKNNNDRRDSGEAYSVTDNTLTFSIGGLAAGTYTLRFQRVTGWDVATPTTKKYIVTLMVGQATTGKNYVVKKR